MPRSNERTARQVRPTALVYCEGAHDAAFINHIKSLYVNVSQTNTRFKVMTGQGGSPDSLVRELLRIPDDYDRHLVKVDNDRTGSERQLAESLAALSNTQKKVIMFCWSTPCLEALLLSIVDSTFNTGRRQSNTLKQQFENGYIPADKRSNRRSYEQHFSRQVLDSARQRIPELDELIKFFEA